RSGLLILNKGLPPPPPPPLSLSFKVVEPYSAGAESVCSSDCPAHSHLSEDHQDPEGEGLRPGSSGGSDWVRILPEAVTIPPLDHSQYLFIYLFIYLSLYLSISLFPF